jgi:hypothetical protein
LLCLFDVKGEGQLKAIVDRLFERRASERTAQFADCLQQRFRGEPGAVPRRAARIERWLSRLWRWLTGR